MFQRSSLYFLSLLFLTGCPLVIERIPLSPPPHALQLRSAASVELFSAGPPRRDYVEVTILEGQTADVSTDTGVFITSLREEAAKIGCDGLVITDGTQSKFSKTQRGTCIVYRTAGE